MTMDQPAFWVAFVQILWIDLLLSGDNAVVIALACRNLPERQRKWGMIIGAGVAIGLRVLFAAGISQLMALPFLKLVGSLLLLWIAVKLVVPDEAGGGHGTIESGDKLWKAVRTIAIADAVMSLDNVIALAAASKGHVGLLVFGLLLTVPLIIAGSALILQLIERFPPVVWIGAALLGWIAGDLIVEDPIVVQWLGAETARAWDRPAEMVGILIVLAAAAWVTLHRRAANKPEV